MKRHPPDKSNRFFGFALALTGILVFLLVRTDREDLKRHQSAVADLSAARHYNHVLDETLLRSRTFLLDDYDSLMTVSGLLRTQCQEPRRGTLAQTSAEELASFCAAIDAKLEAVERFKSANAVVKNSLRYLPQLLEDLKDKGERGRSAEVLNLLFESAADFGNNADSEVARKLKSGSLPRAFATQARIAMNSIGERAESERAIFTPAVENALSVLQADYFLDYNDQSRNAANYRNFLIFACALATMGIVAAFRKIHHARWELSELNRTLESKVAERTTELRSALDQIRESQAIVAQTTKMSALGEMAGGIAHEINTPLGTILICAQMISKFAVRHADAGLEKNSAAIMTTVRRVAKIVQGLKKFCRDNSRDDYSRVTMGSLIEETMIFCQEKFRTHGVEVRISGDLELGVRCIPEQIGQVILNLLNNAYDAIEGGTGPLWIEIVAARVEEKVGLYVSDCGRGIPSEVSEKIMQPFYTTKEIGKGTGLGLSISKGIAEAHGGSLAYVADRPNTTFLILLPEAIALPEEAA